MNVEIEERTLAEARYIRETEETIRKTAKVFGLSKSTVHNDLSKRLKSVDGEMYADVKKILDKNFSEKHIRGGYSTKKKYENDSREKG
ncbi:MAG: sporulation transcriptional regulator SpoIIID [Clostridia bacterium]|nr:sporulation transcriptional regulator SpoIIID [Clostridia bacterium]